MRTFLYIIWILFPVFFFGVALWSKLESISNKQKRENPGDFFSQAIFLTGCTALCIAIDQFFLEGLVNSLAPAWLPLMFFQILLFPMVIYIAARLVGPSKAIRIEKAPNPTKRPRR